MLRKLLPNQITDFWPYIRQSLEKSLPPITYHSPQRENNIMRALMQGRMTAWIVWEDQGAENYQAIAVLVTHMVFDAPSGVKSLELYSFASIGKDALARQTYIDGMNAMNIEAEQGGCARIIFYSNEPFLIELARGFGFDKEYTFMARVVGAAPMPPKPLIEPAMEAAHV